MTQDEHDALAARFRNYLLAGIAECRRLDYNPTAFHVMLDTYGAVGAVQRLLLPPISRCSEGFVRLWELKRLDLAAEYPVAFLPEFEPLFTDEERKTARARLQEYGRRAPEAPAAPTPPNCSTPPQTPFGR